MNTENAAKIFYSMKPEQAVPIRKAMLESEGAEAVAGILLLMAPEDVAAITAVPSGEFIEIGEDRKLDKHILVIGLTVEECVEILKAMDNPRLVGQILNELYKLNPNKAVEIGIRLFPELDEFLEVMGFEKVGYINLTTKGLVGYSSGITIVEGPDGKFFFLKGGRTIYSGAEWTISENLKIIDQKDITPDGLLGVQRTQFTVESSNGTQYVIEGTRAVTPDAPWISFKLLRMISPFQPTPIDPIAPPFIPVDPIGPSLKPTEPIGPIFYPYEPPLRPGDLLEPIYGRYEPLLPKDSLEPIFGQYGPLIPVGRLGSLIGIIEPILGVNPIQIDDVIIPFHPDEEYEWIGEGNPYEGY